MTDNKQLDEFFEGVVNALSRDCVLWHLPRVDCFNGSCTQGVSLEGPLYRACNWEDVRNLVNQFFKTAPDVDDDWKQSAQRAGLDPDRFHEILLGVFVCGGRRVKFSGPTNLMHAFAALVKSLEGLTDKVKELNCALAGKKR